MPSSPLQTFNYSYDLSTDRLLSFIEVDLDNDIIDERTCSYDLNGNPTNYFGNVTTFNKENKLASFKKQGEANATTFTYDAQGLRKTKTTASGVTKTFTYLNGTLYREQFSQGGSSYDLRFIYTASGITGVIINGVKYLYLKNNFGDVTGIYDANGNLICRYVYDAWGNHKVLNANGVEEDLEDFVGNLNPIRYRGYYYDADLGLYYLKSRYYDSEVGRFISIDGLGYLAPTILNGLNLYAYCLNNPIANVDPTGQFAISLILIKLVKIAVVAVATAYIVNKVNINNEKSVADQNTKDSYTIEEAEQAIKEIVGDNEVKIDNNQLFIEDSWQIRSREDRILVSTIFTKTVDENGNKLTNRSVENLSAEWVGHNILVNSGIYSKPQTQDVNLDCKFLDNAFYTVIGTIILQGLGIL